MLFLLGVQQLYCSIPYVIVWVLHSVVERRKFGHRRHEVSASRAVIRWYLDYRDDMDSVCPWKTNVKETSWQ